MATARYELQDAPAVIDICHNFFDLQPGMAEAEKYPKNAPSKETAA